MLTLIYPESAADYRAVPLKFSGPAIGELPRFGLRGADDGEYILAGDGPVEQQVTLASACTISLDFKKEIKCRVVISLYFRLRLDAAQRFILQSARKR